MGYEVKLYVGENCGDAVRDEKSGAFFSVIGMVDLCKPGRGEVSDLSEQATGAPVYLYSDDGNTKLTHDRYDKRLTAVPVADVLAAIKAENAGLAYRRYDMAIAMLEAAQHQFGDRLCCVMFGH